MPATLSAINGSAGAPMPSLLKVAFTPLKSPPTLKSPAFVCAVALVFIGAETFPAGGWFVGAVHA
ncbi:MAG: hypothetical protein CO060_02165 [Candidatus Yonathbacteria bacterium CG_4_9_14_0_2_um_filter_43_16]|uniref:Uncharacterized protein n=1 Tax=Candidatus Yonathbacteria bacterium CG_4_10_14_0_8_um_filter_43_17 TaxID=1975099 RepID=A0A2M7Q3Y7_9BACT|nr:MAG: hypothetical protein COZ48_02830 [Candidatus Yonathbacteria bacterium CG_4_10_14_3_um_filter_43_12]PIY58141.1 MAG: hypothetical protein COY98_03780 [Candidatus Yonathbacteria bacterium CG_4_10_14_0_8_um_filter_43_17]PJC22067.1 MAG: hypothetical protein CO060_02165 [Candidatus Yonathbacteria bacterium CG_4_9_14_0_2_um_filter_43_16]